MEFEARERRNVWAKCNDPVSLFLFPMWILFLSSLPHYQKHTRTWSREEGSRCRQRSHRRYWNNAGKPIESVGWDARTGDHSFNSIESSSASGSSNVMLDYRHRHHHAAPNDTGGNGIKAITITSSCEWRKSETTNSFHREHESRHSCIKGNTTAVLVICFFPWNKELRCSKWDFNGGKRLWCLAGYGE